MTQDRDGGYEALRILHEHFAGRSKLRLITLYHHLTTLKKKDSNSVTDFIIRAESAATALKAANANVTDALLVGMLLKGIPEEFKPLIAVVNQFEEHQLFSKV